MDANSLTARVAYVVFEHLYDFAVRASGMDALFPPRRTAEPRAIADGVDYSAKLDQAKTALTESLTAIEKLKAEATASEQRQADAQTRLQAVLDSTEDAEGKLAKVKEALKADNGVLTDAYAERQETISAEARKRDRVWNYGLGVVSGVTATLVVIAAQWGVGWIRGRYGF